MRVAVAVLWVALSAPVAWASPRFESEAVPPPVFDGIRAGMSIADARPALAAFIADATYQDAAGRARLIKKAGAGAKYYVLLEGAVVSRIGVEAPARGLEARLAKRWGTPVRESNAANEAITSWTRDGWRIDLSCRNALCRLAFYEPLTAAFFGAAVTPPGVLAPLRPGAPRAEIAKLSPHHLAEHVPAGPEHVRVSLDLERGAVLRSVVITGLPANARALLEHAWGAPLSSDRGPVWFNADRGWRAVYEPGLHTVHLTGYVPAVRFLGPGPGIAALARPILGATREQVVAAYPQVRVTKQRATLALPPMEGGTGTLEASFDPLTTRITRLSIRLPFDTAARRDELVKLMTAKWGTPRRVRAGVLAFPTGRLRLEAVERASVLELRLGL